MAKNFPKGHKHLGGHEMKTHIDQGILEFAINTLKVKTMIDVGCGPGGMVELGRELGIDSYGIDGDFRLERKYPEKYYLQDFTKGSVDIDKTFDLAYSCEFVEHVEEKYLDNFMKAFQKANLVIMTYAPEGTPGHHHVNCRSENYWISTFKNYGFKFDQSLTNSIRSVSTMERDFIRENGLCFKNET